jgi:hypothetical protein
MVLGSPAQEETMRTTRPIELTRLLLLSILILGLAAPAMAAAEFTSDFLVESCTWSAWGRQNPYFSLRPGRQLVLEGEEDGAELRVEVTVLRQLKDIHFVSPHGVPITVTARVVEEREFEDGEIVEVSRNWFARCVETGNILYFGEEVDIYEDGVIVDHHGAWEAGKNGAQPGVIIPATFFLGARYFQEMAPDVAEDRAENTRSGFNIATPAGVFSNCAEVEETSPLSPNSRDIKVYCPGVGLVKDETLELVSQGVAP